eukprot:scaffold4630_cov72-Skeletonema_menzelii.AAC.1
MTMEMNQPPPPMTTMGRNNNAKEDNENVWRHGQQNGGVDGYWPRRKIYVRVRGRVILVMNFIRVSPDMNEVPDPQILQDPAMDDDDDDADNLPSDNDDGNNDDDYDD